MGKVPEANTDINGKHNKWRAGVDCPNCENGELYVWCEDYGRVYYSYECKSCLDTGTWHSLAKAMGKTKNKYGGRYGSR